MLAWRLARRDLRSGLSGLRIVLACLALGVAAVAAVGTLQAGIARGLAADGSRILGGDLEVESGAEPLPEALRAWLVARGARVSSVATLRAMLVAPGGGRMLVELKAVDGAWPLVGEAAIAPPRPVAAALAGRGMVADALVGQRLGLAPGATARLGDAAFTLRGTLAAEPDRAASPSILGPRVLIALADLPATELVQPGSIVEYRLRAVLPPGLAPARAIAELRAAFPATGWRLRDTREAAPGVARFITEIGSFMTLAGLTALLVGGIGVANGVRAWLAARARSIAILRCLGASPGLVVRVALIEVMALSLLGVLFGLIVGAGLPVLAAPLLAALLPVPPRLGLFPAPLALAAACGLLTAASFALLPLARAGAIPGAALFRDTLLPTPVRPPRRVMLAVAALAAALVALVVVSATGRWFALGFCGASAAALAAFRQGGMALAWAARHVPPPRRAWARLGLANLHRPGSATPLMLASVGLGLATLATVALVEGNLRRAVAEQMPQQAPSFFFIDIQNDQMPAFRRLVAGLKGVSDLEEVPSLRARVVAVNGVPAEQVRATPDSAWALRGDRGLTYAAAMPAGTRLTAGRWWPPDYRGPPLISFDAALARGGGVGVGDTIRLNVLGRDLDMRIASLRDIAWRSMALNFAIVASPGLLEGAPHTHIATLRATAAAEVPLLRAVTDAFPNVSAIRVADVLAAVADLLGKVAAALTATGAVALAAGTLVLAGAVAAGQRRRVQEAVILRSLGASRGQIRAAWLVEFGLIGAAAGLLAALVGTLAGWAVMRFVIGSPFKFLPGRLALSVAGALALMLAVGYAGTAAALRAKPAAMLRNE